MQLVNASCPADAARLELRRVGVQDAGASRRDDDNDDPHGSGEREGKDQEACSEIPSGLRSRRLAVRLTCMSIAMNRLCVWSSNQTIRTLNAVRYPTKTPTAVPAK